MAKKILVVDDEKDFLKALTIRLDHAGYETCTAENGEEAFACLEKEKPDLIILDVQMPKMDGLEFVKKLKSDSKFGKTPTIFLTAGAFDIAEEVQTLATAQDFLLKSVDNEHIIERVEKLI